MCEKWRNRSGQHSGRAISHYRLQWLAGITWTLVIASLLGCGMPGEPLPPLLEIPEPVRDLSAAQVGAKIQLRWSVPRLTTEGTRVRRLDRMEIYAAFAESDSSLPDFAAQARLLATLPAREIPAAQETISYELPLARDQVGSKAGFAIKALNDQGKDAGFSNTVSVEIADLPEPPTDLRATLTEKAIRLRWKGGERSIFGGPPPSISGYQVLRAEAGSSPPMEILATTQAAEYEDVTSQFGRTYGYSVRAFQTQGESVATTTPSEKVQVVAVDRFPPSPPQNPRAIAVPGAVEMSWSPNAESDLAGYNVYRSQGGPFQKLNPEPLAVSLFRDATVDPGRQYRYEVRAADRSGNESGPSEEVSLTAE